MAPHGKRQSQQQKVLRATPKAKAQAIRMGAAPWQPEQKEDWACEVCYAKFAQDGRVDKYRFIAGSKLLCRPAPSGCGGHKGTCFLGVASEAEARYEAKLLWKEAAGNGQHNGGGNGRGKPKPKSELEKLREENRRLREATNSNGDAGTNSSGDACASTSDEAVDPRWAELDERIAYYTTVASSAKRDLGKINGRFKDLLKNNLEDAERQVAEAREQKAALRQATLDPQVALAEENKRNLSLKKQLEEVGKSLLKEAEALEQARERV